MLITFLFGVIIWMNLDKKDEIYLKKSGSTNCESCNNYTYVDYYGYYVCDVNLDEDEMEKFITGSFSDCPYYSSDNEYEVVKKQN